MNTTYKTKGSLSDYLNKEYSDKEFIFELIHKNSDKAAMRSKETGLPVRFPLTHRIPMVGTIFVAEGGVKIPKMIRYSAGESDIFIDKQTPDDKRPKRTVVAEFINGRFRVDGRNSTLLNFMMNWDINESKVDRDRKKNAQFRLVDNSKIAIKAMEDDDIMFDVIKWCKEADWDAKVKPLAAMLFQPEVMAQPAREIRHNLTQMAKRDPKSFQRMLDDPKTKRTMTVKAALEQDFIVIDKNLNSLFWSDDSGAPLSSALPGQDVVKDFVAKSFSGAGEQVYKAIEKLVHPDKSEVPVQTAQTSQRVVEAPLVKGTTETDGELLTLINRALEKGIIVKSHPDWYAYKGEKGRGEKGMIKKLRDNEIMLRILKKEVFGE